MNCCAAPQSAKDLKAAVCLLKAVSEENRLKILCILKHGERCVCDIWEYLDMPQNLVSHHLKILRDAGLVASRRDGVKIIYSLNQKKVSSFMNLLTTFIQ